jgi:hypothetical protein
MLLPRDVMEICSEVTINNPSVGILSTTYTISIRNPALCIFAIIGTLLGLYVALIDNTFGVLQCKSPSIHKNNNHNIYWSISFLFFGLMNIAAIPLHCILPVNHQLNSLPQQYPYLWIMDTFCTGVFSSSLLVAALSTKKTTTITTTTYIDYWYFILILCIGCIATFRFLLYDSSIELELWYTIPLLCAALLFTKQFIHPNQNLSLFTNASSRQQQSTLLVYFYIIALTWLIVGLVIDPMACRYSMQHQHQQLHITLSVSWWWDVTRLPAIAFGACDLAFIGLYHHLQTMAPLSPEISKHRQE